MHLLLHQSSARQLTPPVYHARTRYSKASERLFIKSDREPIIDEAIETLLFWLLFLYHWGSSLNDSSHARGIEMLGRRSELIRLSSPVKNT